MTKPIGHAATANTKIFDVHAKCCTFLPTLPNFLVGRLWADDRVSELGRASIERRIADGVGVTPLGLGGRPDYDTVYEHTAGALFGKNRALRCPHFIDSDGGLCGIWSHRNAVCATYFCKFDRGAVGRSLWDDLRALLTHAEYRLALWCVREVCGFDQLSADLIEYTGHRLPDVDHETQVARTTADRCNHDILDVYRAAWRLVEMLPWDRLATICGFQSGARVNAIRSRYRALHGTHISEHLRLAPIATEPVDDKATAVSGYSAQDMLIIPTPLANALWRFDGRRTTTQVVADIATADHQYVDDVLLRRLVEFGVLIAVPMLTFDRLTP